ncbi:reverse transcriptase domain-containing protein [Tanacetum coccineum]
MHPQWTHMSAVGPRSPPRVKHGLWPWLITKLRELPAKVNKARVAFRNHDSFDVDNPFDSIFVCMNQLVLVWNMLLDSFPYLDYVKLDHCYLLPIYLPELFVSSHGGTMTMSLMHQWHDTGAYGCILDSQDPFRSNLRFIYDVYIQQRINATTEVASKPKGGKTSSEFSNAKRKIYSWPRGPWGLYNDRASNIEGVWFWLILIAPDDVGISYVLRLNFSNSNNDAEYEALLAGLRISKEMRVKDIHDFVDSKLVASQVEGSYEAKGETMIKYREKVLELAGAFNRFRITHIPRAENGKADALSKLAAVQFDHLSKEVLVEVLNERFIKAQEVNMVVEEEGFPDLDMPEPWYYLDPLCTETQGADQAGDDCQSKCILFPNSLRRDMISSVTSSWLFMKWGMDIVGPLLEGPGRVKFGIPATIIINNETQFVNYPFAEKLKIQLISTSVYHPKGNGAVERANRSLLRGIKTRLEDQLGLRRFRMCRRHINNEVNQTYSETPFLL